MSAEEILNACDESVSLVPSFQEGGLANPAVHFFRGLKHRNIAAIRHAAMVCVYFFDNVLLMETEYLFD